MLSPAMEISPIKPAEMLEFLQSAKLQQSDGGSGGVSLVTVLHANVARPTKIQTLRARELIVKLSRGRISEEFP